MSKPADFVDELRALHAGAEESICSLAVANAVMEMCTRGNLWVERETVRFTDKNYIYLTSTANNTEVSRAFSAKLHATGVQVLRPECWEFDAEESKLSILPGYSVNLDGIEVDIETLITPNIKCTEYPDTFSTQYYQTVILGASSYLKCISNRPWTNIEFGQLERKRFLQQIGTLRSQLKTKNIQGQRAWRFR